MQRSLNISFLAVAGLHLRGDAKVVSLSAEILTPAGFAFGGPASRRVRQARLM